MGATCILGLDFLVSRPAHALVTGGPLAGKGRLIATSARGLYHAGSIGGYICQTGRILAQIVESMTLARRQGRRRTLLVSVRLDLVATASLIGPRIVIRIRRLFSSPIVLLIKKQ